MAKAAVSVAPRSPEHEAAEIMEQMREAGIAPEPGQRAPSIKDVIHKGDDELPAEMVREVLTSAGYSFIYDTATGDRSLCNRNMLPAKLRQKREDGRPIFTLRDPGFRPPQGSYKCLLHADSPQREEFDALGLPVCSKHNLRNPFQQRRHMQTTHRQEWAAIEEMRQEAEKQADRDFQRSVIGLAGQAAKK